jgi:hypothetical protein
MTRRAVKDVKRAYFSVHGVVRRRGRFIDHAVRLASRIEQAIRIAPKIPRASAFGSGALNEVA